MNRLVIRPLFFLAIALIASLLSTRTVGAALLDGKEMTLSIADPVLTSIAYTSSTFTVGPGPEITSASGSNGPYVVVDLVLDVSDTELTFTYPGGSDFNSGTFNGYILTDLSDAIAPFSDAHVVLQRQFLGFPQGGVV